MYFEAGREDADADELPTTKTLFEFELEVLLGDRVGGPGEPASTSSNFLTGMSFDCFFFPSLSSNSNSTSTSSLSPSVLSSFLLFLVLYLFVLIYLTSPFSFVGCRMCNKLRKQDKIYSNSSFIATKQSELSTGHGSTVDAKGNA